MARDRFSQLAKNTPQHILRVMAQLLTASEYAEKSNSDRWDFAVEIELLAGMGLVPNDLRWLVRNGLVEHRREVTLESDNGRAFRSTGDLTFPNRTCFILTDCGILFAIEVVEVNHVASTETHANMWIVETTLQGKDTCNRKSNGDFGGCVPKWDSERRVLGVNGMIVKSFKWAAINQQTVLCAFEEEGWPPHIDDPLTPHPEQDAKRRLSDTIKCLNRKQCRPVIHFRGDGTGEGVIWEFVDVHNDETSTF